MSTPTERRYRREARYSKQLRVTVEPATAAALEVEADATQTSVSAVIRDAVSRRESESVFGLSVLKTRACQPRT